MVSSKDKNEISEDSNLSSVDCGATFSIMVVMVSVALKDLVGPNFTVIDNFLHFCNWLYKTYIVRNPLFCRWY